MGAWLPGVERFALSKLAFDVEDDDFLDDVFMREDVGDCRADVAGAYHGYFGHVGVFKGLLAGECRKSYATRR